MCETQTNAGHVSTLNQCAIASVTHEGARERNVISQKLASSRHCLYKTLLSSQITETLVYGSTTPTSLHYKTLSTPSLPSLPSSSLSSCSHLSKAQPLPLIMSEQKLEYVAEKEFIDEKFDVERSSIVLEEEENSPIPEVAAIVSNKDDPSTPVLTFRFWVMAVLFSIILSFFNQFL